MKEQNKYFITFSLIVLCLFFSSSAFGQSKLRVAVVAFENTSTWSYWGDNLGRAAADVFVTALMATGKFSMIERDKVDTVLAEQDFGATGRITPQTAAQIGKMLGVDLLLTGSITQFSVNRTGGGIGRVSLGVTTGKIVMQCRLVNSTSGEIIVAAEEENKKTLIGARYRGMNFRQSFDVGLANDIMHPAVEKMVVKIVDQTAGMSSSAHSGRVIKAQGGQVWVNLGAGSGVNIGDEFDVIRMGEELIDPDTGISLGAIEEKIGIIVITEIMAQYSIASIKSGSAAAQDYLKKI